ncbi:MAG: hypothetical protein ACUVRY_08095 [Thermoanaerobaculaceae bacterium]
MGKVKGWFGKGYQGIARLALDGGKKAKTKAKREEANRRKKRNIKRGIAWKV